MRIPWILLFLFLLALSSCHSSRKVGKNNADVDLYDIQPVKIKKQTPVYDIKIGKVSADELMDFAGTLVGVKYCYGSSDINKGFDCSGFVWYVFNHFGIKTPRVSYEFTNVGKEIPLRNAQKGDLILFTGRDMMAGVVGHIGMITENKNHQISFIHASSGNNKGVMISSMSSYYRERFVKVNRVFN
jgi:cell wall-associated NlpC family hydrolase